MLAETSEMLAAECAAECAKPAKDPAADLAKLYKAVIDFKQLKRKCESRFWVTKNWIQKHQALAGVSLSCKSSSAGCADSPPSYRTVLSACTRCAASLSAAAGPLKGCRKSCADPLHVRHLALWKKEPPAV